jgi:hypothetical protein
MDCFKRRRAVSPHMLELIKNVLKLCRSFGNQRVEGTNRHGLDLGCIEARHRKNVLEEWIKKQ